MSNDTATKPAYVPPAVAFRLTDYINASVEEVKKRTVECGTCPVYLLCEAGQGGTGWTCPTCKATGVYVSEPDPSKMPDDVLAVDCTKHKFETRPEAAQIQKCGLCSGGAMELEVLSRGSKTHYILTAYTSIPPLERQKFLKESFEQWSKHYEEEEKKKATEAKANG